MSLYLWKSFWSSLSLCLVFNHGCCIAICSTCLQKYLGIIFLENLIKESKIYVYYCSNDFLKFIIANYFKCRYRLIQYNLKQQCPIKALILTQLIYCRLFAFLHWALADILLKSLPRI